MEEDIVAELCGWSRCRVCGHLHRAAGLKVCKASCCAGSSDPITVRHCTDCRGTGSFRDQIDEDRPWATHGCGSCGGKGVVSS